MAISNRSKNEILKLPSGAETNLAYPTANKISINILPASRYVELEIKANRLNKTISIPQYSDTVKL